MKPLVRARILLVHRSCIFRQCLAIVLSEGERLWVKEVDHTALNHLQVIEEERPDVVLIDLNLPEGLAVELTHRIRDRVPNAKVILLMHGNVEDDLMQCFAAGAHGCVLEDSSLQELQLAIEKVVDGETFCSPRMVHTMFRRLAESARESSSRQRAGSADLTPRELEILHLVAAHLSNKQIARKLSVSLYTVKNHLHHVVEKLGVSGRYEAVEHACKRRWLTAPKPEQGSLHK